MTEMLDGGVDGVTAVEEEADEPRTDEAAAAGDTHHFSFLHLRSLFTATQLDLYPNSLVTVVIIKGHHEQ